MAGDFRKVGVFDINDNVFKLIADDWMLVTAGTLESFNTMTASWGTLGELWNKKIAICFVRPTRYTYEFMERENSFTLSFFEERYREVLNYCGTKSGRDVNKIAATGLVPRQSQSGSVYFEQARLVLECRKIYIHDLDPGQFLDPVIHKSYPQKDYHRMYIGEVTSCLMR
jgi:flavin reductase (DIM6/NTAB) family NADH-FMN oxidoreductase RutF